MQLKTEPPHNKKAQYFFAVGTIKGDRYSDLISAAEIDKTYKHLVKRHGRDNVHCYEVSDEVRLVPASLFGA